MRAKIALPQLRQLQLQENDKKVKTRKTPNNRMLLITEAKKSLKEITAVSLAIPRYHYLIFTETITTPVPMLMPDCNVIPKANHIVIGKYPMKRKQVQQLLNDEEQLYWMTG